VAEFGGSPRPQAPELGSSAPDAIEPDSTAVAHYVSSTDGQRVMLLVGPFSSARQASLWVDTAQDVLLCRGEVEAAFTVRLTRLLGQPIAARDGDLNALLGVRAG
jgi:hypothetical protein